MKPQINKYLSLAIAFFIITLTLTIISFRSITAQSYFHDNVVVPVFEGTIVNNVTTKFDYWDLNEINTTNNRLDLAVGVSQKGNTDSTTYIIGNWYKNQYNDNFNSEVTGTRFFTSSDYAQRINGLIFAKLHSGANDKKDIIMTRENGDLEVYWNSEGAISFQRKFKANGKVAAVGNFTYDDNLEDVAVIMDDTVKIYKNLGNGYLDSIPVYRLANVHASKISIAQINSYIEPYATFNGTTSNKEDLIIRQGDSIRIYNNNNNNTVTLSTILYTGAAYSFYKDFKVADLNNDGYNDIVIVEQDFGINVYKNSGGTMNTTPAYRNVDEPTFHTYSVAVGDFDKNGWNDIVVTLADRLNLYINTKGDSLFHQSETEYFSYDSPIRTSCIPLKTVVADVYNKGGLSVLFSNFGDVVELTENDPLNEIEQLARINSSDTDAVPAPAYVFKDYVVTNGNYHPKLQIYNRGDRDFQKYRIYRKLPTLPSLFYLIDSSFTGTEFIDTSRTLIENETTQPENLFYYVRVVDNSYKVSISSDTMGYQDVVCPNCSSGERFALTTGSPQEFSLLNYPNPFNPITRIHYSLPVGGNVKITIFNSAGQEINILVNEFKNAGSYNLEFDGSNLSSGVYLYRIEAGSFIQTRKMLLLK